MYDLGTIWGKHSPAGAASNGGGIVAFSDVTGEATSHATLWNQDVIIDLGTLAGPNVQTTTNSVNNRHQIVGGSLMADGTTFHAVLWQGGKIIDLGTLGGQNSLAI